MILIGEAGHTEKGSGHYGYDGSQKGDQLQTTKTYTANKPLTDYTVDEVRTHEWYNLPWVHIYRPNDETIANEIRIRCEQTLRNPNVGYSQPGRLTYHNEMMKDPDPSHISTPVECDCSSMVNSIVYVTLKCHGLSPAINGREVTAEMEAKYNKMCPTIFTDVTKQVDLKTGKGVKCGDILLGKPATHTAIIVMADTEQATTRKRVTGNLYLRKKPVNGEAVIVMPKDSIVDVYSTEKASNGALWSYVQYKTYKGYCSDRYLSTDTTVKDTTVTKKVTTLLNLRDKPISGKIIAVMPWNATVTVIKSDVASNGTLWDYVDYNGKKGYCSDKYLK